MELSQLIRALREHQKAELKIVLPDGQAVPPHFHVTEVGRVRKDFIDCGGTVRNTDSCVLQVWVAEGDEAHRLEAGKLEKIIDMGMPLLKTDALPVEVEYDVGVITQFAVTAVETSGKTVTLMLAGKHTACLAPDLCGIDGESADGGCCSPGATVSLGVKQDKCC